MTFRRVWAVLFVLVMTAFSVEVVVAQTSTFGTIVAVASGAFWVSFAVWFGRVIQ